MANKDNYCIIMAGGVGSRFWPMSRSTFPKQFHDILGTGQTLIQMTFERLSKICPEENILIVTNVNYKNLVLEQLPQVAEEQVLTEPYMRNTAPCIAYANFRIQAQNPNASVIVAPSDHLITREDEFVKTIEIALEQTRKSGNLMTLGIKPSRPDTGYGYIQFEDFDEAVDDRVKEVVTFTEKPDITLAKNFLASGDFYWNSGIFVWTLEAIQRSFSQHLPDIYEAFQAGMGKYNTPEEEAFIKNTYSTCENISIDYGVMEKAKNVNVVLSDFGWSDLGTWGSLYTHVPQDDHKNAVIGKNVMLYNCANNMVNVPKDKLVVLQGLNGYIVVESNDTLLVCKKEDEQKIKTMVQDIKVEKGDKYV
ncbi:mannose-1-phosphate guanylyltransferase [Halocola ammonii]